MAKLPNPPSPAQLAQFAKDLAYTADHSARPAIREVAAEMLPLVRRLHVLLTEYDRVTLR